MFVFSKDHISASRRAHVWVDLTMSSVSPALHLVGFVHLIAPNDQRIYIESLLFCITLCIFEHVQ